VLAFYLSMEHREARMEGCPIVALGADAARQGIEVKTSFEAGIKAHLEILGRMVGGTDGKEPKGKAMAILSTMVGAVMLSRVVNDPVLATAFLDAAAQQVREAVATWKHGPMF
jgi:TetR/AcrR family transcriptional regulator, transcriptional repressor for nem operon